MALRPFFIEFQRFTTEPLTVKIYGSHHEPIIKFDRLRGLQQDEINTTSART